MFGLCLSATPICKTLFPDSFVNYLNLVIVRLLFLLFGFCSANHAQTCQHVSFLE